MKKEGEWACVYEPVTNHAIVHYWSPNKNMGKKWVMGNARAITRISHQATHVPLYDGYGKNLLRATITIEASMRSPSLTRRVSNGSAWGPAKLYLHLHFNEHDQRL